MPSIASADDEPPVSEADQMRNQEEQRADRAEQGELQALESLERAEIKVEELEQERDERVKLEATVRSLQEELMRHR
eukprot:Skav228444  [mRNA]  locus=scaffold1058:28846:31661:- [translate_table: standard]